MIFHADCIEPPERILIYHSGTGRTLFIGLLRVTTILILGVSTAIIAPTLRGDGQPWYIIPAGRSIACTEVNC